MGAFKKVLKALGTDHKAIGLLYKGTTIARCKGMSQQLLEGIYALGHQYYENHNFDLASKIFRYLCIHDHNEPRYMAALGACEYQRGEYRAAQHILENAVMLDQKQPGAFLNLAMCLVAQNKREEAVDALSKVVYLSKEKNDYQHECQSAEFLLAQCTEKQGMEKSA